MQTTIDFV